MASPISPPEPPRSTRLGRRSASSGELVATRVDRASQPPPSAFRDGGGTAAAFLQAAVALTSLGGFLSAALVDSLSGQTLLAVGAAENELSVAAFASAEMVRAGRRSVRSARPEDDIEDVLVAHGASYHVLRVVRASPRLFVLLVLDRKLASPALARMVLADVDKKLSAG
jgi:hypothetical protein